MTLTSQCAQRKEKFDFSELPSQRTQREANLDFAFSACAAQRKIRLFSARSAERILTLPSQCAQRKEGFDFAYSAQRRNPANPHQEALLAQCQGWANASDSASTGAGAAHWLTAALTPALAPVLFHKAQ